MDPAIKTQAVERLRTANEILVTVSANPSVDQLAAAIGTTLMLNKLGKHASAIFSGQTPLTLEFLQPEKTIEHNIDNLRDFIISLDKNKADKLHFKVEDDVVRIYITPYKTTLVQTDLAFSQGDFNVEVVLALGVQNRTQVDAALTAHGRILHDATIIAVTAGQGKPSDIGQINWQDTAASSLCEMMMSISESFGSGLIDAQMATAFLTGIVAETDRFRNNKTSPKVMTMSAQLMAAGANQQLIASKLEIEAQPAPAKAAPSGPKEGTIKLDHPAGAAPAVAPQPAPKAAVAPKPAPSTKPVANPQPAPVVAPKPAAPELKLGAGDINIDANGNIMPSGDSSKFVPAPADFKPPEAGGPLPEDIPLPGEHTLLDPSKHQPAFSSSFSADTNPEWGAATKPPAFSAATSGDNPAAAEAAKDNLAEARDAIEQATADQPPAAPPVPPPLPPSVTDNSQKQ